MTKSRCLSTRWGITFRCLHAEELTNIPEEEMIKVKNQQQMVLEKYFKKGKSLDEKDLHCIETRQRFKATPDLFAVDKELCQYGFPRVYVRYPFSESFQTGYMRLSCPHLIKAVDHLEAKGGLQRFDKLLQSDSPRGEEYRENFLKVNDTWNKIFNDLMTDFMRDLGLKFLEKFKTSESFKYFLDTGFIGISKRDVDQAKCLHAHLADHLIRGDNKIGELVEKELMHNGVSTKGCNGKLV